MCDTNRHLIRLGKGFQAVSAEIYVFFSHRYEYLRREGNFERSAGLQIGVDTIEVRETYTHTHTCRHTTTVCEPAGKNQFSYSHCPHDLYRLMDSQKEHSCIMNTSVPGQSVTGCGSRPYLRVSSCSPSPPPAEPSCGRRGIA